MKIFQGLFFDISQKRPFYKSDFVVTKPNKVISTSFYLYFACLANAIAFGSLSGILTSGQIGVIEMLYATAIGGIIYSLLSAQPLILLGGTGPIVVFTALLLVTCNFYNLNFLHVYAWTGLWAGIILVIASITNASNLMRFFSRFVDDIFAALVSVIFIIEAFKNLIHGFHGFGYLNNLPGITGLFLAIGTFTLAVIFRKCVDFTPNRSLLLKSIADFAPSLSIILMTIIFILLPEIKIEAPELPSTNNLTTSGRTWLLDIWSISTSIKLLTIIPAFFAAVLLYLDQNITCHIINESEVPLKKGHGYHLDLLLVGLMTIGFSCFGLPWIVAATVHSVNHLKGLTETAEDNNLKPIYVEENRISALVIHLGIGISIFGLSYIALIPMPVLFGLFIYMGFIALQGNPFFFRSLYLLIPFFSKFCRKSDMLASIKGQRVFTFIQLTCFFILWVIKSSILGILFPIFIALCVPIRLILKNFISNKDLEYLDNLKN